MNTINVTYLEKEHDAWLNWCKEFQRVVGINQEEFNKPKYRHLAVLIEKWGYALLKLRISQAKEHPEYLEYETGKVLKEVA